MKTWTTIQKPFSFCFSQDVQLGRILTELVNPVKESYNSSEIRLNTLSFSQFAGSKEPFQLCESFIVQLLHLTTCEGASSWVLDILPASFEIPTDPGQVGQDYRNWTWLV